MIRTHVNPIKVRALSPIENTTTPQNEFHITIPKNEYHKKVFVGNCNIPDAVAVMVDKVGSQ